MKFSFFALVSIPNLGIRNYNVGCLERMPDRAAEEAVEKVLMNLFRKKDRKFVESYGSRKRRISGNNPARILTCNGITTVREIVSNKSYTFEVDENGKAELI